MLQIKPGENFPVARVLQDHTDTNTYYVRATVRNAADDTLLATINLTDRGSRRFSNVWAVPSFSIDTYVIVTISVYTDSGYTTKSPLYAETSETYLVAPRWEFGMSNYGGGGRVDYRLVRQIVGEEIAKIKPEERKAPEQGQKFDDSVILDAVAGIRKRVDDIKIPEQKEADFSSLERAFRTATERIVNAVESIKIPEQEKIDLKPVIKSVEGIHADMMNVLRRLDGTVNAVQALLNLFSAVGEVLARAPELKIDHGVIWKEFEKMSKGGRS